MRKVHWVAISNDKKIGQVAASYSTKESCPDSCTLKSGGCYAWGLFYLGVLSSKIESGKLKVNTLSNAISQMKDSARIVRHRVAGDILDDEDETYDECKMVKSVGLTNIGYTHTWKSPKSQKLKEFFRASCSDLDELEEARSMGWGTTIIVPSGTPDSLKLPNGEMAYMCKARHGVEGKKDITCNSCTLCRVDSKTINKTIMFEAHGNNSTLSKLSNKVKKIV